jgi:hypothetical protein
VKPGRDPDDVAQAETDHFGNCPVCGALPVIDMRDLAQVLVHVHDAEIKIGESPEPPPLLKKRYGVSGLHNISNV